MSALCQKQTSAERNGKTNTEIMPARRFPSPRSVEKQQVCFVVRDRGGQALAYVFEEEPGRRSVANSSRVTRRGESQ
jgi:hypothetical protein